LVVVYLTDKSVSSFANALERPGARPKAHIYVMRHNIVPESNLEIRYAYAIKPDSPGMEAYKQRALADIECMQ